MNGLGGDKTRFADGSAAMMASEPCACNCCLSPVVQEGLQQSGMRYNDRSSYANNNQQDNQTLLLSMFQAQSQNALEQTPSTDLVSMLAQLIALSQSRTPA